MNQYSEGSYDDEMKRAMGELSSSLEKIGSNISNSSFGSYDNCPNPSTSITGGEVSGGTFSIDGGVHSALVEQLSNIIGNMEIEGSGEFDGGVSRSKESRALKSIGHTGNNLKSQLTNVSGSVTRRIENIHNLQNIIDSGFNKLYDIIKLNESSINTQDAKIINDVQNALKNEMQNQLKALENILKVSIRPSTKSLIDLLKNNESFSALSETLGVGYNDSDASDRLALVYTNLSHLGLISKQVKEALSTLHITLDKYKNINNVEKLKNELSETLKRINDTKTTEQLNKIIKAMGVLENSQHRHSEIVECLKDEKKCSKPVSGSDEINGGDEPTGGDYTKNVGRIERSRTKSTLVTRIKTYEKTLKELFKNFISQINLNFRDIKKDVQVVSDQLGGDIPYDDNIKLFISIFEGFIDDLENEKLFYALIGLDRSMGAREVKIRFMDNLNRLIQSLDVLKDHKYLADIKKHLVLTKENIDTYSDTVTNIKSSEEVKKGGDDFLWTDKLVDQSLPLNTAKIIKDTINKLKFYGSVSMIKANLSRMTKEHTEYRTDYNKLLGKSIGIKLTELNKEYTENIDRLHDKERGRGWLLEQYNNDPNTTSDDKIPRGFIETIYKLQYDSKVGLYKTIEAIDIYLMDFTEQLSGNIEATRELSQMLKQTEIISKWFDDKSGINLTNLLNLVTADVTQTISEVNATDLKVLPELSSASIIGGKNIKEILENSKKAIDSIAVLKNIISMFIHIGDKFGNKTLSKEMYMSPNIIYKNLIKYIWVSAFTMGYGTGGGDVNAEIKSVKKDKNVYEIEKGDKASFFDVKFTSLNTPLDTLKKYEDKLRADIKAKKEALIAALPGAGIAEITTEAELKAAVAAATALSPTAARSVNAYRIALNTQLDVEMRVTLLRAAAAAGTPASAQAINTARTADVAAELALRPLTAAFVIVRYHDLELLDKSIKNDIFTNEDKYFILSLKAITAKILTVIGSANLLKQPSSVSSMITNPIRTIIGGSKNPEVNDEAFELYIRLPLLVEFYKNIFENGNEQYKKNKFKADESEIIAYIPEIGSIWSGLIQCIFDESRYIANGIYSVENMKKIIFEVNNIFKTYKNVEKAKLVRTVILDLVSEVNRRYGILKRQEINEFYQIKKKYTKNMDDISINNVNFDILDDTNEYEDAGPSSQYTENVFNKTSSSSKIIQTDINIVKDFRDKIHKELFSRGTELKDLSKKSFTEKIKFYKNELKNLQSNEPKIELIIKAIDESSNINSHNTDVNLMFHELVISPLKNLQVLDNWAYAFFSNYIPQMYSSYHLCQIDNAENVSVINSVVAVAPANIDALKTIINTKTHNPNLVTKFILQCCDTLGGITPPTVADAITNADIINTVIATLSTSITGILTAARINNYQATNTALHTLAAAGNTFNSVALFIATIAGGPAVALQPEVNTFIGTIISKFGELLLTHPIRPATGLQEEIDFIKLRSDLYKFIGSFINIQPQLNEVIDTINNAHELVRKERTTAAVPVAESFAGPGVDRSLYQINQDNFVRSLEVVLSPTLNKVSLVNFVSEMTFDNNNLLNMKFLSSNKFILDYTKLQEYIEKSIENIKYMISKFRNQLPKIMVSKYESCVFNIEDKLLFKILNNQDTTDVALFNVYNLELVNNSFGEIINNTRGLNLNNDLYNSIMFSEVYSFANADALSVVSAGVTNVTDQSALFNDVFKRYIPATRSWTRHDQAVPAGTVAGVDFLHIRNVYGNTNTDQTNNLNNGLVYKFNTLIFQYLSVFYDSSTKKIYNNLFNEFATKSQSSSIFGNTGIADIFTTAPPAAVFLNKFVQNDLVLCESLAIMFKTFINRTTNVQLPIKYHLQTMLSEVSPNMVEKYKVFLPVFITLFESLIQKSLLYKKIIDTTEDSKIAGPAAPALVGVLVSEQTINGDIVGENQTYTGRWLNDAEYSQGHYNNTIINLIEASRSLINDATVVLNEINVKQQYFELKENFIKNFYNNSNTLPLMPMSLTTTILNNGLNPQSLLPNNMSTTFADNNVKFLYGINSIINNKSLDNNINNYIWLKEAFNAYNSSVLSINKIEVNKINDYLDINNTFTITLSKLLYYNRFFSKFVNIRQSSILANVPAVGNTKNEIINSYFTLPTKSIVDSISITENSAIENSKMKISNETIVNGLTKDSFNLNRSNARLLNIIDLNIIPINVHALMREIPLINVYNYAFTYDSIIKGEFGDFDKPSTKEEMLAHLLLDPYYICNEILSDTVLGRPGAPVTESPAIPLAGAAAPGTVIKYTSTYDLIKQTITEPIKDLGKAKFLMDMANNSLFGVPGVPVTQSVVDLRLNNKFTRNVIFLVNLQRVIMYKIKKEVERIDTKVVSDISLLNPKITGYDNDPAVYDDKEFEYLEI